MNNIFLTGFMGVGKSEVGQIISKKLDWTFFDTDRLLEEKEGKHVSAIYKEGEERFRDLEAEVISKLILSEKQVIALGGGAMLKQNSRLKILGAGHTVYLLASPKVLLSRLDKAKDVRPILEHYKGEDKLEKIRTMLLERGPVYQLAHTVVDTDGKTPEIIAQEIFAKVSQL